MNFRVLVISTAVIIAIFAGFVIAFLNQTPTELSSSPGNNGESQPTTTVPQNSQQPGTETPATGNGTTTP